MKRKFVIPLGALLVVLLFISSRDVGRACCAVSRAGGTTINADQTVILLWDKERKTQHFIRKASFRGNDDSVGFLVPSPTKPQLEEAGDGAFPFLAKITEPPAPAAVPFGCSADTKSAIPRNQVQVIEEKTVAGYDTVVLAADSGTALVQWLKDNGYAHTPEVAKWAQPYLDKKWFMVAMKITKSPQAKEEAKLAASALRISFETERPLFPYREPDSRKNAEKLGVKNRFLKIYFIAEARYEGRFSKEQAWTGNLTWSRPLTNAQRSKLLAELKLDPSTGPEKFWLSEFVDQWPYGIAPGDVWFSRNEDQSEISMIKPPAKVDPTMPAMAAACLIWPVVRRRRKR